MRHFAVFGTHPRLSLAEFKAIAPAGTPTPALCGAGAVIEMDGWDGEVLMSRLGGTVKLGNVVLEMPTEDLTGAVLADLIQKTPRGERVAFGLTILGGSPALHKKQEKLALDAKRVLVKAGRSVRWVTSEDAKPLSPAAVAKMRLTDEGYDIVLLVHGATTSVGLTTHVQDADAWSLRDYGRPVRDDENGMLPPKLARMMVNLARVHDGGAILDPFCGSGTVLMEAAYATHAAHIIGSDLEDAQVAATKKNLDWMFAQRLLRDDDKPRFRTFAADAREIGRHLGSTRIDAVVTEGDLGPPLTGHETKPTLEKNARDIEALWRDALTALRPTLAKNGRVVGVWPSFKSSHGVARVDLTDELDAFGYALANPLAGWDESNDPLLYHRQGQRVMRRIFVLTNRG